MDLKMVLLVNVTLLVFLLGSTATVDARFDPTALVTGLLRNGMDGKSTNTACCNGCYCTESIPPQCHCGDVGTTCHAACRSCLCLLTNPPKCRCYDVDDFCYAPCPTN